MNKYDNILNISHFEPKHKRMSIQDRSAQFAPFDALTGYKDEINNANIFDDNEVILDNYDEINNILCNIKKYDLIEVTYLNYDKKHYKYLTIKEKVKKIDDVNKILVLNNNLVIEFKNIKEIKKPSS